MGDGAPRQRAVAPPSVPGCLVPLVDGAAWARDLVGEAGAAVYRIAQGDAEIVLRTRVARQVTLAKVRYGLALDLHIIDNGPGIAPDIRDRIFYPLVSGRDGGSGLGLTLAQTFVQQHLGVIECESRPGLTDFRILLPLP